MTGRAGPCPGEPWVLMATVVAVVPVVGFVVVVVLLLVLAVVVVDRARMVEVVEVAKRAVVLVPWSGMEVDVDEAVVAASPVDRP
jgi:hypothetical protein